MENGIGDTALTRHQVIAEILVFPAIEDGERQYVISVRGPLDDDDLLADAEALAESFTIPD